MKRLLAGLVLATAAVPAGAAQAASTWPVQPVVWTEDDRVGAGAFYDLNGTNYRPLGGAWVNPQTGEVCVGLSYQIPQCAGGPVE
ncbi:MAG TPA: hypothetical protein VNA20_12160 [Frankiaceae bacterium]|nr:hypothetical protein [Frankiaceae bacterium]